VLTVWGERGIEALQGNFNCCAFDPEKGELTLINCRHGARHLFYRITPEYFAFATEMKALVAIDRGEVDRMAVQDMFNFGYIGGQRTMFSDIHLLEQGSILEVSAEKCEKRKYWDYSFDNADGGGGFDSLVEEGGALFDRAVQRLLDRFDNLGIPLSGGLDSRTILALASRYRQNLDVFHCAWYEGEERIARALCRAAGGHWHRYDPLAFDIADSTSEGVEISDGNVHCHQFWFLSVVRDIVEKKLAGVLFDGYLMDVFFGDTFLVIPQKERYTKEEKLKIINSIWRRCRPIFVEQAFLPEFYREYEEANRASIEGEMIGIDEPHLSNFIQRYSLANRSNRYSVALPNVQRQYVEYAYPGLDYELTDFYLRLPPEYKVGARYYRELLMRHALPFAQVPWVKTGKPLNAERSRFGRAMGRLPLHQLAAIPLLRLSGGRIDLSHRADLNRHFRRNATFRRFFTSILEDERTWSRGIIDRKGVERLIGFIDRGWPVFTLIQSLITVELWYRKFIDE